MKYLNLVRYKNLILLAFMQLLFRYGFLKQQNISLALADYQFYLLVLSTVLIAAGGYIINNIYDQNTDVVNNPNKIIVGNTISENLAYNLYVILTLFGVCIGYYLSNLILRPGFLSIFIFTAALLYFYATTLKQIMIVGNFVVAFLLAFSVLIIGVFDIFPATDNSNRTIMTEVFLILKDYAIFAFIINFIREIVKDLEDYSGDLSQEMQTLPIVIGLEKTSRILSLLITIPVLILLVYINNHLMINKLYPSTLYGLIFLVAPLIFCAIQLWNAKEKMQYNKISLCLKIIILFGIISIVIIYQNIKYNAERKIR